MRGTDTATFPKPNNGVVLLDAPTSANPGRTTGQQISIPLNIQPPIESQWTVLGWGAKVNMQLVWSATGETFVWLDTKPFGRLGKLIAGITYGTGYEATDALPADTSLLETVWDGNSDPSPPLVGNQIGGGASGGLTLARFFPQEIPLVSGIQLAFGLWLTRSVVNDLVIAITSAQCVVHYDTG